MTMQMDAYLKKEQIGTLFVRVGSPEGGLWGGGGKDRGGPAQKSYMPLQFFFWSLLFRPCKILIFW